MEERFVLGIDVGGTNIRAGLVDAAIRLTRIQNGKDSEYYSRRKYRRESDRTGKEVSG